jgi:adenine deaminase
MELQGTIIDPLRRRVFTGTISVADGKIQSIRESDRVEGGRTFMPGLVDAHVHIESSMLVPTEFARIATIHGTVATVSDPHEIGNVLGIEGVRYMLRNAEQSPMKFHFGAPSCVPATTFETSGSELGPSEVEILLDEPDIGYLSEVMNYPGVIARDSGLMKKIAAARQRNMPVDGHAPGVRGEDLRQYVDAGISTDHESFTYEEGKEKLELGLKLLIREGSAARNFDALEKLIAEYPDRCMFCSDDKHPDDLVKGHIDALVRRAIRLGHDFMSVLRSATVHPVQHYDLPVGLLQPGDPADIIEVAGPDEISVLRTWIDGELVAEHGNTLIDSVPVAVVNNFEARRVEEADFAITPSDVTEQRLHVIGAINGQIVTDHLTFDLKRRGEPAAVDVEADILKIAVVNRYKSAPASTALIKGFGLKKGAIASSVAHDSHNIVAVGTTDSEIATAVNLLMESRGGLVAVDGTEHVKVGLPVAGLMSDLDGREVARQYEEVDDFARRRLGSMLDAPFMTLSFMALLVIPSLKISDLGLFDGNTFSFSPVMT